jgi:hypothetical protein
MVDTTELQADEITALKQLLLDSHKLDELSSFHDEVNLFDILKIADTEIRHSNMLAWLLDPMENHGIGDAVLKRLIQWYVSENDNANELTHLLLLNYFTFSVQREFHNIDLFLLSDEAKVFICIENKVYSGEHSDQLNRYRKIVQGLYPDYTQCYIFLSPYGDESSDPDTWKSLGYGTVAEMIDNSIESKAISDDVSFIINHYLSVIRRIAMENQEVIDLCNKIYRKHKYALDLIFENKDDSALYVTQQIRQWCEEWQGQGHIIFDINDCGVKGWITFNTARMNEIFVPDSELNEYNTSYWKNEYHYVYAVHNKPNQGITKVNLEFSLKGMSDDDLSKVSRIQSLSNVNSKNAKQLKQFYNWYLSKYNSEHLDDFDEQKAKDELFKIITVEIPEFEKRIAEELSK